MASFRPQSPAQAWEFAPPVTPVLMNAGQCRAKADEIAAKAGLMPEGVVADEWRTMAEAWRILALHADCQDALQPILAQTARAE